MEMDLRNCSREESGDETPFFLRLPDASSPHEMGDILVSPSSTRDLLIGEDFVVTSLRSSRNGDDGDRGEANENETLLRTPESLAIQGGRLSVTPIAGRKLGGEVHGMTYATATLSPPTFESLSVSSKNSRPPRIPNIRLRLSGGATTMSAPLPRERSPSSQQLPQVSSAAAPAPPLPVHLHRRGRSVSDASVLSALTDGSSDFPPNPCHNRRRLAPVPSWNPPEEGTCDLPKGDCNQKFVTHRPVFGGMDINVPMNLQQPILTDLDDVVDAAPFEDIEPLSAPTPRTTSESPSTNAKRSVDTGEAVRRRGFFSDVTRFEVEAESLILKAMAELQQIDNSGQMSISTVEIYSAHPMSSMPRDQHDGAEKKFAKRVEERSQSLYGLVNSQVAVYGVPSLVLLSWSLRVISKAEVVSWGIVSLMFVFAVFIASVVFFSFERLGLGILWRHLKVGDYVVLSEADSTIANLCLEESTVWIIEQMGLLATIVRHYDTRVVATISNQSLARNRILNLSRSGPANVTVSLSLALDTPLSKILILRKAVELYVRDRREEWQDLVAFRPSRLDADLGCINYDLIVQHQASWEQLKTIQESKVNLHTFCLQLQRQLHGRRASLPKTMEA